MKLVCTYEKSLEEKQRLFPRDVRNYINSIIPKELVELKEFFAWHNRSTSPVIYPMPNRKGFAVISYKKDKKTRENFKTLLELIQLNPHISFAANNTKATIKRVFINKFDYTRFEEGIIERPMRTPLIIAASKQDYAKAREATNNKNSIDYNAVKALAVDSIKQSIIKTNIDWFSKEQIDIDKLIILIKNIEYIPVKYKDNEWYPAIKGTIVSNVMLPDFIGYKIGMGYGELMRLKEMDRRGLI